MSTVTENLINAHDCAEFVRTALMQAHAKATAVESLALYPLTSGPVAATVAASLANGNTIAYTQPSGANKLQDNGGNLLASFAAQAIVVA